MLQSILTLTGAVPRYNPRILQEAGSGDRNGAASPRQLTLAGKGLRPSEAPFAGLGYIHYPGSEDDIKSITHWLVVDLDTQVRTASVLHALCAHARPIFWCILDFKRMFPCTVSPCTVCLTFR